MYAPKMAATRFLAPVIFSIFICFSFDLCLPGINLRFSKDTPILSSKFYGLPLIVTTVDSRNKIARSICTWHKRGHLSIAVPSTMDLTIHMDVESNPGPSPSLTEGIHREHDVNPGYRSSMCSTLKMTNHAYNNSTLGSPLVQFVSSPLWNCSRNMYFQGNFRQRRFRGSRAGRKVQEKRMRCSYNIRTLVSNPSSRSKSAYSRKNSNCSNHSNLTIIPHQPFDRGNTSATRPVNFCLLNTRSVNNKTLIIKDFVAEHCIDLLAVTETWLQPETDNEFIIRDLCPTGYSFHHVPRSGPVRGGGVGLLFRSCFNIKLQPHRKFISFEYIDLLLNSVDKSIRIVIVYRPPPSNTNGFTPAMFLDEFFTFLEQYVTIPGSLLIVGDFNFHDDTCDSQHVAAFLQLLDVFNLNQHTIGSTHKDGHTLDLVITRSDDDIVSNLSIDSPFVISDHAAVHFHLMLKKPVLEKKLITFRKLRSIDFDSFGSDVTNSSLSSLFSTPLPCLDDLISEYNGVLSSILDIHAPVKTKTITLRPAAPWYSEEINNLKKDRRRLERRWRRTKLPVDRQLLIDQCRVVNSLICSSKRTYYTKLISDSQTDYKLLFKTIDSLLHRKCDIPYPPCNSPSDLANKFVEFFSDKITKIRVDLDNAALIIHQVPEANRVCPYTFDEFSLVDVDEVRKCVVKLSSKSCDLDPLPGYVTRNALCTLLPFITKIINTSLQSGQMPSQLKVAKLRSLLKKPSLDHTQFSNYRPVSNLTFLSKAIEKLVANQLISYVNNNNLNEPLQSAYKQYHSTETALIRVHNDILTAIDKRRTVILLLLDLSAAFDTVDHDILLFRLQQRFGVTGKPLLWFKSYLSNRMQFVSVDGAASSDHALQCGVPQGSVLGPILYVLYTSPLSDIVKKFNLSYHFYADDSQLYLSFQPTIPSDRDLAVSNIERCVHEIDHWMLINRLKLNKDKTELLVISAKHLPRPTLQEISVVNETICSSQKARNIGVIFDHHFRFNEHIASICKSSFYHLRNISNIRKYLSSTTTEILVHAFVSSKLDNCNSLLYGLPNCLLQSCSVIFFSISFLCIPRINFSKHLFICAKITNTSVLCYSAKNIRFQSRNM